MYFTQLLFHNFVISELFLQEMEENYRGLSTPIKCPLCEPNIEELCFATHSQLQTHLDQQHKGHRSHHCPYCGRMFKRQWVLQKHIRIHTGERPYKCDVCGRAFTQSQHVTSHKLSCHKDGGMGENRGSQPSSPRPSGSSQSLTPIALNHPAPVTLSIPLSPSVLAQAPTLFSTSTHALHQHPP